MFTALLSALPALSGLLKGGQGAASSCQQALAGANDLATRMTAQRNGLLVMIPVAFVTGFVLGRRSR